MLRKLIALAIVAVLVCTGAVAVFALSPSLRSGVALASSKAVRPTPTVAVRPAVPTSTPVPTVPPPTATPAPTSTPVVPPQPQVQSPTDPNPSVWYANKNVVVRWTAAGSVPVVGFGYVVNQAIATEAPKEVSTKEQTATLNGLKDGTWYVHVRALGADGQWSPTATFPIHLDTVPLTVTRPRFSAFSFNPHFFTQKVWFTVSRPATAVVTIKNAAGKAVRHWTIKRPAAGEIDLTWNGKSDTGAIVAPGLYSYTVSASDPHGHHAISGASGLNVTEDRIVVSLSKQELTAYDGNTPVLSTVVTTGNPALPTPVGVFPVLAKFHPFTFHSPWPKGSRYWYADSPVTYALLFDDNGYYIHDAPWRHAFGPGTNLKLGTPGTDYTGSHGCVNVPFAMAQRLFNWAPTGTAVQVVP